MYCMKSENGSPMIDPMIESASKTVDSVLYLLEHNLSFRVEVSLNEAASILKKFRSYNDIPKNLFCIVLEIRNLIGPIAFPGQNPNNGSFGNISFSIGNEGSLVIYIKSRLFYRPEDTASLHKSWLESIGNKYNADEIDVTIDDRGAGPTVCARLWWD